MMHKFHIPIFDVTVYAAVSPFPFVTRKSPGWVEIFGPDEEDENWDAICLDSENDDFGLIFDKAAFSKALFAHEIYHLTRGILRLHSVKNEEAGALLNGYLTGLIGSAFFNEDENNEKKTTGN